MRFYYFSLFSWMAYGVAILVTITLFSLLWTRLLKFRLSNPIYWVLVTAIVLAPWAEELWIAYNFDRLCRTDGGVFISKTVEVDGYLDETRTDMTRIVGGPPYKFVETPDGKGNYRRIERATDEEREQAILWYGKTKGGRKPGEKEWFTQPVDSDTRITVEMDTGYTWRITKLDKPTARYKYEARWSGGAFQVAHKVSREDATVIDTQTGEVLGEYISYARGAYWFFISTAAPTMSCDETKGRHALVYQDVLKPTK